MSKLITPLGTVKIYDNDIEIEYEIVKPEFSGRLPRWFDESFQVRWRTFFIKISSVSRFILISGGGIIGKD